MMNGGPRPLFHCVFCVLSRLFLSFVCFIANRFHFGNRRKKRRERRKHKRHRKTTNLNIGFTHTLHFFFIYNQKESAVSKGDPMLRLVIFQCPSRLLPSRHKRLTPCGQRENYKSHGDSKGNQQCLHQFENPFIVISHHRRLSFSYEIV